jgi:radical SAM protein with 4Fe4S-binding SPASM domain
MHGRFSFDQAPLRVYWEITRACGLACRHCRAEAAPNRAPEELSTEAGFRLLTQLAAADPQPHVVLTGGDPLERPDLWDLIAKGRSLGLGMSVSPSATPRLTRDAIKSFKDAGVEAISLSLDGATAASHDGLRGVPGTFARTLVAAEQACEVGLPFQVNTLVARETLADIPAIEKLARSVGAARWSLFFLVTVGRGTVLEAISPDECDELLSWLADRAAEPGMIITTTEAPHFRRVVSEKRLAAPGRGHAAGIRDGNGILFVSHDGTVYPSGFLPVSAGNVRDDDVLDIYRRSPLFLSLRNVDAFHGRCGSCEVRAACGGSRARAYLASGDLVGEDPLCTHQPATTTPRAAHG